MEEKRALADRPADVVLSSPERLAKGYRDYQRYRLTVTGGDGVVHTQSRDVLLGGKVVAVLPVDPARGEIVLIRQFRLPAHLANGCGDMIEVVAGRVEANESLAQSARRECQEEIGVAPEKLVELFSYLPTPGITEETVTVFLAAVDAGRVPTRGGAAAEGEQIEIMRVSIDQALAALTAGKMRNGLLIVALQWLALNRGRLRDLLGAAR